jgi:hypothetical protein
MFHEECGKKWLKQSTCCPLCKQDLRPTLKELLSALDDDGYAQRP